MANEYREKYLTLKNEYTVLKNSQTGMMNDVKREVETHWTGEIRRTDEIYKNDDFKGWANEWQKRLKLNNSSDKHLELMKKTNPIIIPRNQKVEEALADADKGNLETMNKLLKVLSNPYSDQEDIIEFQKPTPIGNEKYQTFCGT